MVFDNHLSCIMNICFW